jgi:hypothetical protein
MYVALRGDLSNPGDTIFKLRMLQSFDRGAARYAIHRTVRCLNSTSISSRLAYS